MVVGLERVPPAPHEDFNSVKRLAWWLSSARSRITVTTLPFFRFSTPIRKVCFSGGISAAVGGGHSQCSVN